MEVPFAPADCSAWMKRLRRPSQFLDSAAVHAWTQQLVNAFCSRSLYLCIAKVWASMFAYCVRACMQASELVACMPCAWVPNNIHTYMSRIPVTSLLQLVACVHPSLGLEIGVFMCGKPQTSVASDNVPVERFNVLRMHEQECTCQNGRDGHIGYTGYWQSWVQTAGIAQHALLTAVGSIGCHLSDYVQLRAVMINLKEHVPNKAEFIHCQQAFHAFSCSRYACMQRLA